MLNENSDATENNVENSMRIKQKYKIRNDNYILPIHQVLDGNKNTAEKW